MFDTAFWSARNEKETFFVYFRGCCSTLISSSLQTSLNFDLKACKIAWKSHELWLNPTRTNDIKFPSKFKCITLALSGQTDNPDVNNVSSFIHSPDLWKTNAIYRWYSRIQRNLKYLKKKLHRFTPYLYCSRQIQSYEQDHTESYNLKG